MPHPVLIDYYFTVSSPWTTLGHPRFLQIAARYGAEVRFWPVDFGLIFPASGGLPLPKRAPQRQAYRMMELKRWRDELDIPIVLEPRNFPSDETLANRLLVAAEVTGQAAVQLSAEIGRSLWEHDQNIGDAAVLQEAAQRAGLDAQAVRAAGPDDDELDAIVAANSEDAVSRGVFGAPSYVFEDGEIMWGQDRLLFVRKKLQAAQAV